MKLIRKISIGGDYKSGAMHYAIGQEVYDGHKITDIVENNGEYEIYIRKGREVKPWKSFNKNMPISVEYSLKY